MRNREHARRQNLITMPRLAWRPKEEKIDCRSTDRRSKSKSKLSSNSANVHTHGSHLRSAIDATLTGQSESSLDLLGQTLIRAIERSGVTGTTSCRSDGAALVCTLIGRATLRRQEEERSRCDRGEFHI